MRKDFCVFILSYKRANNVYTIKSLADSNYTGDWYIVLGNDDPTIEEYIELYGKDKILIFDKEEQAKKTDVCDNFNKRKVILYARNYCFEAAKQLGYKYFLELDDDYVRFEYRYPEDNKLKTLRVEEFDDIVDIMIDFLDTSNAYTVAFAQGGDLIGGCQNSFITKQRIKRKAMNSFFCTIDRPFKFIGSVNEDVNTYCHLGSQGKLFMTICNISLVQKATQKNKGGMTEEYQDDGTYMKSFYSVITNPSFVKISAMGDKHFRIHHKVNWEKGVPKVISSKYKKTT